MRTQSDCSRAELERKLSEAVADCAVARTQQAAAAQILRVIAEAPESPTRPLAAIAESAASLCDAYDAVIMLKRGNLLVFGAHHGPIPLDFSELSIAPTWTAGRALIEGKPVHVQDLQAEIGEFPDGAAMARRLGHRTTLSVPLLRKNEAIGTITLRRFEVRAFTANEVSLLETFANEAVIAIENARLFSELGARNRELSEALEQQTATGEILRVISSSPTDAQPVFDMIAQSAARLCGARFCHVFRLEGDLLHFVAHHGLEPAGIAATRSAWPREPGRGSAAGRAVLSGLVEHIPDVDADLEYALGQLAQIVTFRSTVAVPMLREGVPIGAITVMRSQPGSFPDRQIDLLKTFADQAVIAIENVRLFAELEARNRDLGEALEQQTATSDVLSVIASSPIDITPVLTAVADNAIKLCDAYDAVIFLREEDVLRTAAHCGPIPVDFSAWPINPRWVAGRTVLTRTPIQVHDLAAEGEEYPEGQQMAKQFGHRTILCVPLLRQGHAIGCLVIRRVEVRPFTEKQIALLETFADQAVIAIENVRLFIELEARNRDLGAALEQQTASSEVLSVISRSPADLQPVLDAIVTTSARLCHAEWAIIFRRGDDARYHVASASAGKEDLVRYMVEHPVVPDRGKVTGRTLLEARTVHVVDVLEDPEYSWQDAQAIGGYRTALGVPLLRKGKIIGVLALARNVVKAFTEKEIALVTTFANQAVIAIENVRLFEEVQARSREVTEALEQQTVTAEILRVISTSLTDAQPVFETIVRNAVSLCGSLFANVFRFDGELLHFVASHNVGPDYIELLSDKYPMRPDRSQISGRVILAKEVVRLEDALDDPDYDQRFPPAMRWRRMLGVPMLRDGEPLGVIIVGWAEAGPVPPRQEELLKTFADQAAIAIENVRLFDEVQARTRALTRSVDELHALDEVSQAVTSSLDLETVLETIVSRAVDLSESYAGVVYEFDDAEQIFQAKAAHRISDEHLAALRAAPVRMGEGAIGRAGLSRGPINVTDIGTQGHLVAPQVRSILVREGMRSLLAIPLVREERVLGGLVILRREPGEFSGDVIALLRTFAAHSVLAIQNARLFREIEDKGRQLAEASRHKSQFLANMSHELRTPLNAILGYTELVLDGIYGEAPEKMQEVLERVQSNGRHLLGLINDVLDLSKIEAGQLTLSLGDYSLADILQGVQSVADPLAAEKGLDFRVELPPDVTVAHGDARRLAQVLLNLVGNAIKFTDTGEVGIEAHASDGTFRIAVRDTGPGIAAADQDKIFGEFQQADSSSTRKKGGTGLGLSISRRIVEMHGGRIDLESEPGHGATFTVVLPIVVERQVG